MTKEEMRKMELEEFKKEAERKGQNWEDVRPRSISERWEQQGNPFKVTPPKGT